MTEIHIGKRRVVDNHNTKNGKAYQTIFKAQTDEELTLFLKQKGLKR